MNQRTWVRNGPLAEKRIAFLVLAGCVSVLLSLGPARSMEAGSPVMLAPHSAEYKIALVRNGNRQNLVFGAEGLLSYSLKVFCDGWGSQFRMSVDMAVGDGETRKIREQFAGWEDFAGAFYQFARVTRKNDGEISELRGYAKRENEKFAAYFIEPAERIFPLQTSAMLPNEHTVRLIKAAQAGEKLFLGDLFDGAEATGAFRFSAAIGGARQLDDEKGPLAAGKAWPISLAFYERKEALVPSFQQHFDMLENGVIRSIVFNYGDFSLRADLLRIKAVAKPDC